MKLEVKMKRIKTYITLTTLAITSQINNVHADVRFANKEMEKDFTVIYEKYQSVRKLYATLDSSEMTYVVRYGKTNGQVEGKFETDGNNLYIILKKDGSPFCKYYHDDRHPHRGSWFA